MPRNQSYYSRYYAVPDTNALSLALALGVVALAFGVVALALALGVVALALALALGVVALALALEVVALLTSLLKIEKQQILSNKKLGFTTQFPIPVRHTIKLCSACKAVITLRHFIS